MIYTILSAKYANEDNTAAVIMTKEAAAVLASEKDTPEIWKAMLASGVPDAYEPPPPPPVVVSKVDLFRRMTEAEVDTLYAVKATMPLRSQSLFDSAPAFHETAEEWPMLKGLFEASYGQARAAELLAPST